MVWFTLDGNSPKIFLCWKILAIRISGIIVSTKKKKFLWDHCFYNLNYGCGGPSIDGPQESERSTHGRAHQANGSNIWSVGPTYPSEVAKDWMVIVCLSMLGNPLIYSGWISNVCPPLGQMFHLQTAWCINPAYPALETDDGHTWLIILLHIHGPLSQVKQDHCL